jgi:hypothetical protein
LGRDASPISDILPNKVRKLSLTVIAVCLLPSGCQERSDLDRLVGDGATTCTSVSDYYDQLGAMTVEAWQNEAAFKALAGGTMSDESQGAFQQRLDALARRSRLAQAIGNAYISLASLRSPDGLTGVVQAGQSLGTALSGVPALPGGSAIDSGEIGQAAQFLVGLKRKSDSRKALASMAKAVAFLSGLVANEKSLYTAIQEDRDGTADRLLRQLA